ncbi:TaqI-like C-terminal specificity domain-containing protein [Ligilactobacillus agilis]|nr:TaqI-like C-terminal specificity domain-containing protein [Ligilactobacillus agilis]
MSDYIRQHAVAIDYKLDESWIILSEIEQSIKKKIEAVGTPLKDWDISINYGIKTGLNEAFIISKEKRDELIKADPKSAEIIRPILRGRDIRRYEVDFQNLYLINTHNGYVSENGEVVPPINIEDYPAIKDWLDNGAWNKKIDQGTNIERLAKRTDQGVTPYNLRSLAYMDDFLLPKIVWSDISTKPQFALIDKHILINNTAYMITRIHPGAIHILNSRLMKWYFTKISSDLGVGSRYFKQFVELLPLPLFLENKNFYDTLSEDNTEEKLSKFYHLNQAEIRIINQ